MILLPPSRYKLWDSRSSSYFSFRLVLLLLCLPDFLSPTHFMVIIRLFLPPFDGVLSYRRVSDPVNILSPFSLPYHKNPILHGSFLGFTRWFIVLPLFLSNPYFLYNSNLSVPVYADSPSHILFPSSHSMHCIVCIIISSLLSHPSLWQDPPRVTHRRFCISRLHSLMP